MTINSHKYTVTNGGYLGVYFVLHLRLILGRIPSSKPSFWAVFRPPKNSYSVLRPVPEKMVFRPPDRFSAVFGPPGPPRYPH